MPHSPTFSDVARRGASTLRPSNACVMTIVTATLRSVPLTVG
jgi:hypothetical protein